jgi:hypothetical protein
MLECVDRIQLAVADAAPVARAFRDILGAETAREDDRDYLNARRTVVALGAIVRRLDRHRARFTPRGGDPLAERDGLWIHPSALGGLLLGISRTALAREWSGRPELVAH